MIYFLQRSNGDIKIGVTHVLAGRYEALCRKHGEVLKMLGIMAGSFKLEKELHAMFTQSGSDLDSKGIEWFEPTQALLDYIEANAEQTMRHVWSTTNVALTDDVHKALGILVKKYKVRTKNEALRMLMEEACPNVLRAGEQHADIEASVTNSTKEQSA